MSLGTHGLSVLQSSKRLYHFGCVLQKSHYDTLGLTSKATQADVKSAFYRLSKLYHPDTNANDPKAADKFREVLEAYEVLSSNISRSQYDRGGSSTSSNDNRPAKKGFKVPEDPQAAFYKSRLMRKMDAPGSKRYNFDAWTQSHYSDNFERRSDYSPPKQEAPQQKRDCNDRQLYNEQSSLATSIFILVSLFVGVGWFTSSIDRPKR